MWSLKTQERLHEWNGFRRIISNLSFDEAILNTMHLWSYAPIVNHYLDKSEPTEWPTPWELLRENKYDDTAKALGMLYTLFLSDHGSDHSFNLVQMKATSDLETYNIVNIDSGKYILNYTFDEISTSEQLSKDLTTTNIYSPEDLHLTKY